MTARRGNGQAYLNKYTGTADPRNPQNGEKMATVQCSSSRLSRPVGVPRSV